MYPTPGETSALQPADRNTPDCELQRNGHGETDPDIVTEANQATAVTTEEDTVFWELLQALPKDVDLRGTLNTDPKPPNCGRRFLRKIFQMVTGNRSVLRA